MISAVIAFKQKLKLVSPQLQQHALRNFRNVMIETENQGKQCDQFNSGRYAEQVQNLASDFDRRFRDIAAMEPVATYMYFPLVKTKMLKILHLEWPHYLTWIHLKLKMRF